MKLKDLLEFDDIVVQCHDIPDADAIASGYGVYSYLKANGKKVKFIYGGGGRISKSSLSYLIEVYDIPVEHVSVLRKEPQLLISCDCQFGNGNVQAFEAENYATIDHHQISGNIPDLSEVRPGMGSCATIVWDMLKKAEFHIDDRLATILFYGLYMDTNALTELAHPLDKDMYDELFARRDQSVMKKLVNMNITLEEAKVAGKALLGFEYDDEYRYAIVETESCDPNLLGLISDLMLSVDKVDVCAVYSIVHGGVKYSIRSCETEVQANELAGYIAHEIGTGGGHRDKAGGFLDNNLIDQAFNAVDVKSRASRSDLVRTIIEGRLDKYFSDTTIIYSGKFVPQDGTMKLYERLPHIMGYVIPSHFVPTGSPIIVRTIMDDIETVVTQDTVIMIGSKGRIFLTDTDHFNKNYVPQDCLYTPNVDYFPTIRVNTTGVSIDLAPFTYSCMFPGGERVLVKKLNNVTKVFGKMMKTYIKGDVGDYLAVKENDPEDIFIIGKENFRKMYQEV